MPLGIVDAAHIFTALTDPLMACILMKGKRANIYIDDLLSACQGFQKALLQKEVGFSNPVNPQAPLLKESLTSDLSSIQSR